jgi:hypothetical protein
MLIFEKFGHIFAHLRFVANKSGPKVRPNGRVLPRARQGRNVVSRQWNQPNKFALEENRRPESSGFRWK